MTRRNSLEFVGTSLGCIRTRRNSLEFVGTPLGRIRTRWSLLAESWGLEETKNAEIGRMQLIGMLLVDAYGQQASIIKVHSYHPSTD